MTATNHALTGAFIGLSLGNPLLALPAAFLSHFVCDALPHFNVPGETDEKRIGSKSFFYIQIVGGAILCAVIVLLLALWHPRNWLLAAICAFLAASPDLLSAQRFVHVKRTGKDIKDRWWFWRFHAVIQWFEKPIGAVVEVAWLIGMVLLLMPFLR